MKNIFTLILVCTSFLSAAQQKKDSATATFLTMGNSRWAMSYGYSTTKPEAYMMIWDDNQIEIIGDTMQAIRNVIKSIKQRDSIEMSLYDLVGASVDFLNHVPDYWKNNKNNCAWSRYWALLRKQGFYQSKKSKPKPCNK